ncbi:MAG: hypothetical protein ABII06_10900 [Pseudomonadota bacterium]
MRITNSEVIKVGENELIDAISADIDWSVIEQIFKKEHKLCIEEDVEYKKGDIVVHNEQVAYRLEFQVSVTLSVLLDRQGHCISVTSPGDMEDPEAEDPEPIEAEPKAKDDIADDREGVDRPDTPDHQVIGPVDDPLEEGALIEEGIESEKGYEKALSEIDNPSIHHNEDPGDKIAKIAAHAGDIISEML